MKLETPPNLAGKTLGLRPLSEWLSRLVGQLREKRITVSPAPALGDFSEVREWNALSGWLAMLHSQIAKPFAQSFPTVTKTTTATLRIEEIGVVFVDSSAAAFTITLPPAAKMGAGGWFRFIKTDSSANAVTLDGSGAETINGAATVNFLDAQYDFCALISNGSNWLIMNRRSTAEI